MRAKAPHRAFPVVVVAAFVTGVAAAVIVQSAMVTQTPGAPSLGADHNTPPTDTIFPSWRELGAERIELSQVRTRSGLSPERPSHPLANDRKIAAIWYATLGGMPEVAFEYSSGAEVKIEPGAWIENAHGTLDKYFKERAEGFVSEPGANMSLSDALVEIHGMPALIIHENFAGQQNRGFVEFVTPNRMHVIVYAAVDNSTLLDIARSVSS